MIQGSEEILSLLEKATAAVQAAVSAIPPEDRGEEVAMGADGEPTTRVDKAAEDALIRVLEASRDPLTLISEEAGILEIVPGEDPLEVLADPIDSTKNCIAGIPYFSSALQAFRGGVPVAAAIRNLANGDLYLAQAGKGATLNGKALRAKKWAFQEAIVAFGPVKEALPQRLLKEAAVNGGGVRLMACPSLSIADVAAGRFGAFLGLGMTGKVHRIFDVSAAAMICEEAGVRVTDADGLALPRTIHDLKLAVTVIAAAPTLHGALMDVLSRLR